MSLSGLKRKRERDLNTIDEAVKLVMVLGWTVKKALQATNYPCDENTLARKISLLQEVPQVVTTTIDTPIMKTQDESANKIPKPPIAEISILSPSVSEISVLTNPDFHQRRTDQTLMKSKRLKYAQDALERYNSNQRLRVIDMKNLLQYILPEIGAPDAPTKSCRTHACATARLAQIEIDEGKHWSEFVPPPQIISGERKPPHPDEVIVID